MIPGLLSFILEVAPGSAELIKQMQAQRLKDRDILMVLLAVNLEQSKKLNDVSACVSDIRQEQVKIKGR